MIQREYVPDDKGRVTAGLPSLTPQKRHEITDYHLSLVYQRACQQEYFRNEQNATAADGAIDDVTDWEQVVGMPLSGPRIIGRLRKMNPMLWFEQSHVDPTKTGIYLLNSIPGSPDKQFICGMETEINPEFTVRVLDSQGNAKGIIGGWRRVLMRLIRARLITEARAWALFGPPSRDSENWARMTQ